MCLTVLVLLICEMCWMLTRGKKEKWRINEIRNTIRTLFAFEYALYSLQVRVTAGLWHSLQSGEVSSPLHRFTVCRECTGEVTCVSSSSLRYEALSVQHVIHTCIYHLGLWILI